MPPDANANLANLIGVIMKKIWIIVWEHRHGVDTYAFREQKNAQIIHDRLDSFIDDDDEYDGYCDIQESVFMEDTKNFNPETFQFL
ncbi:hypothetical protein [uncultured Mediterranean phage uvMED]|nr:hypothetical protein [uncultured Mediterranean phage uvMED]